MRSTLALVVALGMLWPSIAGADRWWTPTKSSVAPREHRRALEEAAFHLGEARRLELAGDGMVAPSVIHEQARAALAAYERALDLGPNDPDVHYRALAAAKYIDEKRGGGPLCATCRDGFEAVVRHGEAVLRLDPRDPRALEVSWEMCIALSKLGGLGGPDAASYFQRAVDEYAHWARLIDAANPDHEATVGMAHSNAAELFMALGRLEDAIDLYRTSIELNPSEPLGYYGLAVAYDRDGQWEKAKTAMAEALAHDRGILRLTSNMVFFVPEGDVYYYKGLAYAVRGDTQAAIAEFGHFLARAKDSPYAARAREHLEELKKGAFH